MPSSSKPIEAEKIVCGDTLSLVPSLPDRSVNLCLTSPPYAEQRKKQYGGVPEKEYPAWMCKVMAALRPKLTDDGSVLLVIRSHVRDGVVSDYVLRTRLALREDGWKECEELVWLKPDAPPLGSIERPRRTWENILWFSMTPKPYIDLNASGAFSDRIGFGGSQGLRNGNHPIATKRPTELQCGRARTPDHFTSLVSENDDGIRHPAMFPVSLCEKLIQTFSREGDLVLDPFCGSGTTLVAAQHSGRNFIGFEANKEYVRIAKERLAAVREQYSKAPEDVSNGKSEVFRLKHDFPQRPRLRRILLQSNGLSESDVRIFEHVLQKTVLSAEHGATAPLSVNQIATNCGLNRSTVIRSLKRLQEHGYVVTVQDEEWWRHRESEVGPAPELFESVRPSGGITAVRATSSSLRSGLHNLDCFVGLPRIESASVQVVLTDLPTGATDNNWDTPVDLDALWGELKRILKPNGAVVMFAHFPFDKILATSNFEWLRHEFIWVKEPTGFLNAKYAPLRAHETILVFAPDTPIYNPQHTSGGTPYRTKRKPTASTNYGDSSARKATVTTNSGTRHATSVLNFRRDRDNFHATGKPVAIVELLVRSYSNPGDLIVDPCAGSCSVAIAAMNASRQFIGFERDKTIFDKASKRIREHAKVLATTTGSLG